MSIGEGLFRKGQNAIIYSNCDVKFSSGFSVGALSSNPYLFSRDLASGSASLPSREHKWTNMKGLRYNLTTNQKQVRNYVFGQAKKLVMKQTGGLYPAPFKIMEVCNYSCHTELVCITVSLVAMFTSESGGNSLHTCQVMPVPSPGVV